MRLVALAMVLALVLAVVIGVLSAVKQYSKADYTATFLGFLFLAMPAFWLAILLKQGGHRRSTTPSTRRSSTRSAQASMPLPEGFGAQVGRHRRAT